MLCDLAQRLYCAVPLASRAPAVAGMQNPLVAKGCKCTKSRCIKGYCECFSAGRGCLAICGCQDCANVLGKRPPMPEEADYLAHEPVRVPTKAAAAKAARGPSPPELADAAPKPAPTYNRRPGRHRAHAVSVKRALSSSPTPDSSGSEVERMAAPRKHNLDDLIAATEAVEATGQQDVAEPPPAQQRKLLSGSWEHLLPSVAELQCTAHQTAPPPGLAGASDGPAPRAPYAFQRSDDRCDMKHEPVLEGIAGNG